jgi:hypothetical protein
MRRRHSEDDHGCTRLLSPEKSTIKQEKTSQPAMPQPRKHRRTQPIMSLSALFSSWIVLAK